MLLKLSLAYDSFFLKLDGNCKTFIHRSWKRVDSGLNINRYFNYMSLICMNGIRSAINLSSSWCKSNSGGLIGHFIPLATDNLGTLPSFNADKQV